MVTDLAYAQGIAAICARALGEHVRSVILHGSLAVGDYIPGRSDIDLLAIVDRPLGRARAQALTRGLIAEQAGAPGRVDFRVATAAVTARPSAAAPMELYVGLADRPRRHRAPPGRRAREDPRL
jgi:hypothetical protein